jgi:hypothetical protein
METKKPVLENKTGFYHSLIIDHVLAAAGFGDCLDSAGVSDLPNGFFFPRSTRIGAATKMEE